MKRPERRVWRAMIERCENPNFVGYKHYGARGIKVCSRWRRSFENFMKDLGPRPPGRTKSGKRPLYSLDRYPDNDGNYEPNNCRWATHTEQRHNQRPYDESARVRAAWKTRARTSKNRKDLTGMRFGRLIVLKYQKTQNKETWWSCRCACGVEKVVNGRGLKRGGIKSCGCLKREVSRQNAIARNCSELTRKGWITRRAKHDGGRTWHGKG